jgi:amidase
MSQMTEPDPWAPAHVLAAQIRAGEVSSRDATEMYLERIARSGRVNAVVTVDAPGARRQADAADEAVRQGRPLGPLHGVPITVKDLIAVAGVRSTNGEQQYQDFVPEVDAVAVSRLRGAGVVILGKTNTPARGADVVTHNAVFGTTRNPWDLSRTPGGSSGGSGAAVAAGLAALDLGGDIGGSIRLPAHFCGVFGHKPSFGVVPTDGQIPVEEHRQVDMVVLGPLARSAADLGIVLDVISGPPAPENKAWSLRLGPPRRSRLDGYRLGVWLDDDPEYPTAPEVQRLLEQAIHRLADAGASIISAHPVDLNAAHDLYFRLLNGEVANALPLRRTFAALRPLLPARSYALRQIRYLTSSHTEWLEACEAREEMRARWAEFFEDCDALLCPVAPISAPPLDARPVHRRSLVIDGQRQRGVEGYLKLTAWNTLASAAYLPATVAPVGYTTEGLPVGLQIIAGYLEDTTAIDIAAHLDAIGLTSGTRPDVLDQSP